MLALVGCHSSTHFSVQSETDLGAAVELHLTLYGDGLLITSPDRFPLAGKNLPGSLVVFDPGDLVPHYRYKLDALSHDGTILAQTAGQMDSHNLRLTLKKGLLPDRDADGVPDVSNGDYDIDDCPQRFDPDQRCAQAGADGLDLGGDDGQPRQADDAAMGPDPALIAWYRFDEVSGTSTPDSSPNGQSGRLVSGSGGALPSLGPGARATALHLDGETQYVSLPPLHYSSVSDFTLSTWFDLAALDHLVGQNGIRRAYLLDLRGDGVIDTDSAALMIDKTIAASDGGAASYELVGYAGGSADTRVKAAVSLQANTFYHAAFVRSGSALTLYLNGVPVAMNTAPTLPLNFSHPKRIGTLSSGKPSQGDYFFPGAIDEVRIYTRALSVSELKQQCGAACP